MPIVDDNMDKTYGYNTVLFSAFAPVAQRVI
jgi:hypothetical protein